MNVLCRVKAVLLVVVVVYLQTCWPTPAQNVPNPTLGPTTKIQLQGVLIGTGKTTAISVVVGVTCAAGSFNALTAVFTSGVLTKCN